MAPDDGQERQRARVARLMALGRRQGHWLAAILVMIAGVLAWQAYSSLAVLILGPSAGLLSARQALRYHQGGEGSHWLLSIVLAFSGWPLLQLLERNGISQWEQGMLSLQYFSLMGAAWLLFARLRTP